MAAEQLRVAAVTGHSPPFLAVMVTALARSACHGQRKGCLGGGMVGEGERAGETMSCSLQHYLCQTSPASTCSSAAPLPSPSSLPAPRTEVTRSREADWETRGSVTVPAPIHPDCENGPSHWLCRAARLILLRAFAFRDEFERAAEYSEPGLPPLGAIIEELVAQPIATLATGHL